MIPFATHKYGRELLVDAGWIHDYTSTFVLSDDPHRLGFHEVLLVTQGAGRLWLRGVPHHVRPGRVFLTAPGEVRRWQARDVDGRCLFFTAAFLTEFFADGRFLTGLRGFRLGCRRPVASLTPAEARWFSGRLGEIETEIAALRQDSDHLLRARLYELLVWIDRRVPGCDGRAPRLEGAHLDRFLDLVDRHVGRQRRVSWYARALGITAGHLNDLCRRHLSASAGQVVRGGLVAEMRRRLQYDQAPAARIALDLGFEDPSYFSRFFARETGTTPSAFRAAIREKHQ